MSTNSSRKFAFAGTQQSRTKSNIEGEVRSRMPRGYGRIMTTAGRTASGLAVFMAVLFLMLAIGIFVAPQDAFATGDYAIADGTDPGELFPAPNTSGNVTSSWVGTAPSGAKLNSLIVTFGGTFDSDDITGVEAWDVGGAALICTLTPVPTAPNDTASCTGLTAGAFVDAAIRVNLAAGATVGNKINSYISGGTGTASLVNNDSVDADQTITGGATPTVAVVTGTDPTDTTPCPGSKVYVDQFGATESTGGATTITDVIVGLTDYTDVSAIFINSSDDLTNYHTSGAPASNTQALSLGAALPVSASTTTNFKIWLTLNAGATGAATAKINSFTLSSGTNNGSTDTSNTFNIDAAPSIITAFSATSGQDGQVPISWTIPGDGDLDQLIAIRNTGGYVTDHTAAPPGTNVYTNDTPSGGEDVTTDTTGPPSNGTTYYYAVFAVDNCGTWNDTVTPDSNAGTGTPSAGGDVTAPTVSDVTPSNVFYDSGTDYVDASYDVSANMTEAESTVTDCDFSTNNGGSWTVSGSVGGSSPNWTCTASGVAATDTTTYNLLANATSTGGTGQSSVANTVVGDTSAPTDGTLTVNPGDGSNGLSWTAASDSGSNLDTTNTYLVVNSPDSAIGANCSIDGNDTLLATQNSVTTTYNDTPLSNGTQIWYMVCAQDNVGNISSGTTDTGTPTGATGDVLSGSNVVNATTADPSDLGVLMQKVTLTCSVVDDGECVITNVGVQDNFAGGATHIDKAIANISSAADCGTVVATGSTAENWDASDTPIAIAWSLTGTEYLCIYYDFEADAASLVQSKVTSIVLDTTGGGDLNDSVTMGTWQSNSFAVGVAETDQFNVIDCNDCHGIQSGTWAPTDSPTEIRNAPAGAVVGDHATGTTHVPTGEAASECVVCHGSDVDSYDNTHRTGVVNMAADGDIDGGKYDRGISFNQSNTTGVTSTCTSVSCHGGGTTPVWGVGTINCDSCHKVTQALSARHGDHYNTTTILGTRTPTNNSTSADYIFNCGVCHDVAGHADAGHANGSNDGIFTYNGYTVDIVFNLTPWSASGGAYWNNGAATGNGNFPYWSEGQCSSVYCHSDGKSSPVVYNTPKWSDTGYTCVSCHDDDGGEANDTWLSAKHASHIEQNKYNYNCGECHAETVADNTSFPITGFANHVNGVRNVVFGSAGSMDQSGGTISALVCSNTYCHDDGQDTTPPFTSTSPDWDTGTTSCTSCHSNNANPSGLSAPHAVHVDPDPDQNYTCDNCHSLTLVNNQNSTLNSPDAYTVHVNGIQNVVFSATAFASNHRSLAVNSAGYNGTQCTNVYCHSDVQGSNGTAQPASYATLNWASGAQSCTTGDCHDGKTGSVMATGSHGAHLTAGYDCVDCHRAGGDGNIGNHVDGYITVIFNAAYGGSGGSYTQGAESAPENGYGSCSSNYCHGSSSDAWNTDNSSYYECTQCHGSKNAATDIANAAPGINNLGVDTNGDTLPADFQVGVHNAHITVPSNIYNTNGISCDECHPVISSVDDADHITTDLPVEVPIDGARATNGTAAGTYTPGSPGTCSATYCHDTAYSTSAYEGGVDVTPRWTDDNYINGTAANWCEMCHGNPPGNGHDANPTCSSCHLHVNSADEESFTDPNLHIDGIVQADADCYGCHGADTGGVRQVTKAGGDFVRGSRHVSDGTTGEIVTMWDCIVCHLEGNASTTQNNGVTIGDRDPNYHNYDTATKSSTGKYPVNLRNVDNHAEEMVTWNINGTMGTSQRDGMDSFCMNCHDDFGSADIAVANGDPPATPFMLTDGVANTTARTNGGGKNTNHRPFNQNDTLHNVNDLSTLGTFRTSYGNVLDVKRQFNSTNRGPTTTTPRSDWASHHNLNQFDLRYANRNSTAWPAIAWTSYTTKENVPINGATGGEIAGLHCSDCHLNETNAHGSANAWYMLANEDETTDPSGSADVAPAALSDSAVGQTTNCFRCHADTFYAGADSSDGTGWIVQFDHGSECDDNQVNEADEYFGRIQCLACHGGFSEYGSGGLGAIHGNNDTYMTEGNGTTTRRFRFMSGATMRWYNPNGATDFTGDGEWTDSTLGGCYTVGTDAPSTGAPWAGGCVSHDTTGAAVDIDTEAIAVQRGLDY